MMRSVVLLLFIFFFTASFGDRDFDSRMTNFSFDLSYHSAQDSDRDVVISPYAIWSFLISMAYETSGATREQFSKVLFLTEDRSEFVTKFMELRASMLVKGERLKIALLNFLFYDENFNLFSDSITRLEDDFGFITQRLSFGHPRRAMNGASQTVRSHRVNSVGLLETKDFVDSTMIVCNFLSFSAKWSYPFDTNSSRVQEYYRNGKKERSTFMYKKALFRFANFRLLHASVTELPYLGTKKGTENYCMLLIRPHLGYNIKQVFGYLREVSWRDMMLRFYVHTFVSGLREVEVKLPTSIRSYIILDKPLLKMGLSDVFDQNSANFSNLAEDKIYFSDIWQNVIVTFSESGTEIISTTPASGRDVTPPVGDIEVEDPFIFLIMDKFTNNILFAGSYSKIDSY